MNGLHLIPPSVLGHATLRSVYLIRRTTPWPQGYSDIPNICSGSPSGNLNSLDSSAAELSVTQKTLGGKAPYLIFRDTRRCLTYEHKVHG